MGIAFDAGKRLHDDGQDARRGKRQRFVAAAAHSSLKRVRDQSSSGVQAQLVYRWYFFFAECRLKMSVLKSFRLLRRVSALTHKRPPWQYGVR